VTDRPRYSVYITIGCTSVVCVLRCGLKCFKIRAYNAFQKAETTYSRSMNFTVLKLILRCRLVYVMAGKSGGHGAPHQKSEDGARVLIELGRCGRCRWQYGAKNTARHRRCNGRATREINLRPIGGRRANIRDGQVDKFPTIFCRRRSRYRSLYCGMW